MFLPTSGFSSVLQRASFQLFALANFVQLAALQQAASTHPMPLGRSDATPHHAYFILLGAAVIIVLAVLPFACEGPLRRWNKSRRGRLE